MFFNINEKTLKDLIENQKQREQEEKVGEVKTDFEYDGHKLRFLAGRDGSTIVDAEPSLIKEVPGDKNAPHDAVDILTPMGWAPKN